MTPEYPRAAAFIPAKSFHFDANRHVRRIVIHCTSGGANADRTAAYFAAGADGKHTSAHFVVGSDGTVIQCVRLGDVAHHAHTANSDSIGIEHAARAPRTLSPTDQGLPPSSDLYQASALLCAWLCDRLEIPRDRQHIVSHHEADPDTTHTACPEGDGWQWDRYMTLVQAVPVVSACMP